MTRISQQAPEDRRRKEEDQHQEKPRVKQHEAAGTEVDPEATTTGRRAKIGSRALVDQDRAGGKPVEPPQRGKAQSRRMPAKEEQVGEA